MYTLHAGSAIGNNRFETIAKSFLQQRGLPFADVLSGQTIQHVFEEHDALFAQDRIFSTQVVLWAYLAQSLRDGKGAACAAAVADVATYLQQTGGQTPSGDTGDYCRARAKLALPALRCLASQTASEMEQQALRPWLWHDLHGKLVDGFEFTMADTPSNQEAFPQIKSQKPGVGLPIARACGVLSLATAAIHALAIGPHEGKGTGETALLREIEDCLLPGDVAVFDRYFASYWTLASLSRRGVAVCTRLHQRRSADFQQGQRLGEQDYLTTWKRPARPEWMSPEQYEQVPATLTVRAVQFQTAVPGQTTEIFTVITTLTDPVAYPRQDIMALYGYRWNVELDIRSIKQTLGLDHIRCMSPDMVQRDMWVKLLAYNLIRKVIATAAAVHGKQPRQLGFTLACQTILSSWMLIATGRCSDERALWHSVLKRLATNIVADRPGRMEPRVLKRRRHRYRLMTRPRRQLREELRMA